MWGTTLLEAAQPLLACAIAAVAIWVARRHSLPRRAPGEGWRVLLAAALGVLVVGGFALSGALSLSSDLAAEAWRALHPYRFALPLLLGLVMLGVLCLPRRRREAPAVAHLVPRTWRSFITGGWLWGCAAVAGVIIALTLAAGSVSQPDDAGRYTMYIFDLGSGTIGTSIYGWHHSAVPLVLVAFLIVGAWRALATLARPPLGADHALDTARRRQTSTDVLRVTLGALLLHMQVILASLAHTARLTGTFHAPDGSFFTSGTPFSALTGTLEVSATLAGIFGLGLWIFTGLTALPLSSRPVVAPATS